MASVVDSRAVIGHALLTAAASALSLIVAEALELTYANLAVWTTYLVIVQYTFTSFQKGVERTVGRGLGILGGLILTTWLNETPILTLALICLSLMIFFYFYFAGRLAYTFLQAGFYLVAMFEIGHADPSQASQSAMKLFVAIVVGVVVAVVVNWIAGAEENISIQLGGQPLWPLRGDWINQSAMLVVTVLLAVLGAYLLDLPAEKAAITVMLLTVTPHLHALVQKGELRIVGLALGTVWSLATFLLVGVLPYFPLLVFLLFLGLFIAAYLTQTAGTRSYAGFQMGLVVPIIVVAPPAEFGSIEPAIQRLEGVVLGLVASVIVASLWPRFSLGQPVAAPPAPVIPAEVDI